MIISEKQINELINIANTFRIFLGKYSNSETNAIYFESIGELLTEITRQQSDELKVIK